MRFEHWVYTLPLRWRTLVRRRTVEQDLDDELQYHVETTIEDHLKAGLSPDEARRLALGGLRDVDRAKEDVRDTWGLAFLDALRQDVRYGARTLEVHARVHDRGGADAGARHRREHRCLQPRGRHPALAAAVSPIRSPGQHHRHLSERRVRADAPGRSDDGRRGLRRGALAHAHRRRRADAALGDARLGGADVRAGCEAARRAPAAARSGHGAPRPVRHLESRLVAVAFPRRRSRGRPLHRPGRRRQGSDRGHADVVSVPVRQDRRLGAARHRRYEPVALLGWRLHARRWPASCRRDSRAGARRDSPLPVGHRRRISLEDAGRLEPRRCGDSDGGGGSDRRQAAAADPDGRRRTRADHRLRECRQPEPVAGDGARARDRHPRRHWRRALGGSRGNCSPKACCSRWSAVPPACSSRPRPSPC